LQTEGETTVNSLSGSFLRSENDNPKAENDILRTAILDTLKTLDMKSTSLPRATRRLLSAKLHAALNAA
jgi:hypothetical protein